MKEENPLPEEAKKGKGKEQPVVDEAETKTITYDINNEEAVVEFEVFHNINI